MDTEDGADLARGPMDDDRTSSGLEAPGSSPPSDDALPQSDQMDLDAQVEDTVRAQPIEDSHYNPWSEVIRPVKRACTAALRDVLSRVHAAHQHETVKASIPNIAQLKGSIPRHAPLERLFSGPRSRSAYLNTTRQTLPATPGLCMLRFTVQRSRQWARRKRASLMRTVYSV